MIVEPLRWPNPLITQLEIPLSVASKIQASFAIEEELGIANKILSGFQICYQFVRRNFCQPGCFILFVIPSP